MVEKEIQYIRTIECCDDDEDDDYDYKNIDVDDELNRIHF